MPDPLVAISQLKRLENGLEENTLNPLLWQWNQRQRGADLQGAEWMQRNILQELKLARKLLNPK
jgi:hypothetical protein